MTRWNMTEGQITVDKKVIATGQQTKPFFEDDTSKLEERVSKLETKLDRILNILEKKID